MISLSSMTRGTVTCRQVHGGGPEITRLKRLGICVGRQLEIVHSGDPMILKVAGTRVGLSRQLADAVLVEPAGPNTAAAEINQPAKEQP
ncbi:MAG: ferrous iron transport protein A [Planctomycetaceae bacterium]|nr:ferrous iron transport protein A [Planctomycetaceae bacterium]